MKFLHTVALLAQLPQLAAGFSAVSNGRASTTRLLAVEDSNMEASSRRNFLAIIPAAVLTSQLDLMNGPDAAFAATGAKDGNLPDLPSEASRSYLQYRIPLQIAADAYIFDLQDQVVDIEQWGVISQLFRVNNNRGQGQPSKIERDYVNPMRILLLSMPPDVADEMRDAQFRFEKAMNSISKLTSGYSKDLPVEIPASTITAAGQGWEDGRVALNDFFVLLNEAN